MAARPEDYLLLMFSMKSTGRRVDFNHVKEKLSRDMKISSDEKIKKILNGLIQEGYLEEVKGLYGVTEKGKNYFSQILPKIEEELKKVNRPWVIVYKAKQYYPFVAETVFEFCKDRYTGFYCLHPQTPILTPLGFIPVSNIKVGDKVFALDGNYFRPCVTTNTFCRDVKENVFIIKPYYLHSILITKNHPILVRYGYYKYPTLPRKCKNCGKPVERKKANYCLECSVKRREDYKKKYLKWYFGRSQEDPRRKKESFGLGERKFIKFLTEPRWILSEKLYEDWLTQRKERSIWKKLIPHVGFPIPQAVRDISKMTQEHCEFLGYYAAEGSSYPSYLSFEVLAESKSFAERIGELCEKLFSKVYVSQRVDKRYNSTYTRITTNSKKAVEFVRKFCPGTARTKQFHPAILWLPPEKQLTLVKGFMRGDGCTTKVGGKGVINFASTTSFQLVLQLQLMLFRNKLPVGLTYENILSSKGPGRCYFLNYFNPSTTSQRVGVFEKNILWVPIFSIKMQYYSGKVYNLEVQGAQNYLTPAGLVHNCLFTEKRFFRRDFRGKKIVLKSPKDLLFFVDIHCVDVIPCVHRIGKERPDWLVVDIDPGPKVSWQQTKEVAEVTYKVFEKFELNPVMKFSGSRGFQIWSLIKDFEMPESYRPLVLRGEAKRERNYFSLFADFVRLIQRDVEKEIPRITTSETLAKEAREDKVLLDPSSMKPMGLVRSPYGMHSKTGLVSLPLSIKELKRFEPEDAGVEKVLKRFKKIGNEFLLKPSSPKKLLDALINGEKN